MGSLESSRDRKDPPSYGKAAGGGPGENLFKPFIALRAMGSTRGLVDLDIRAGL